MTPQRLVLASGSPRRRELLDRLDLEFAIAPADIDETPITGADPSAHVRRLARAKAETAAATDAAVIGADTVVVIDGQILGKPDGTEGRRSMLDRLVGRSHEVVTGVAVTIPSAGSTNVGVETTTVHVAALDRDRIEWYVATGEGTDKAGGYALQGAAGLFADRVEGSVSNVIGLPLPLLDRLCHEAGFDLLSFRGRP